MRDLPDLLSQVRNPDSREHLSEAVRAFQAGALRSAIVSAWVSVSLDLTEKIRTLAEARDSQAVAAVKKLDAAIDKQDVPALQRYENKLLLEARDTYEFINHREYEELERLYKDRNLCAHPAFVSNEAIFHPSPELVRSHIATAVDAVLSQPATPGKMALTRFLDELKSTSWPTPPLEEFLRERFFTRSRATLRRGIVQVVIKGCIDPPEDSRKYARRCFEVANALDAVAPKELADGIASVVHKREEGEGFGDRQLLRAVGSLGRIPAFWQSIPASLLPRIVTVIRESSEEELNTERVFYSGPPLEPSVATAYQARVDSLSRDAVNVLVRRLPHPQFVPAALGALTQSKSFRSAEENFRSVLHLAPFLSFADLKIVADTIKTNRQVSEAADVPDDLVNLYHDTKHISGVSDLWRDLAEHIRDQSEDPSDYYAYPAFCALALGEAAPAGTTQTQESTF